MKLKSSLIVFICLTVAVFACMFIANGIQTAWGTVSVEAVSYDFTDSNGKTQTLTGKLYKPVTATAANPAPAVLMLHGYQNDKETNDAYSIELSRRGIVVLSLDEYGHGWTTAGLKERGWTNHKVTVNYGEDSEEAGTYKKLGSGGAIRYKIMMNFSNLSFFKDKYSKGDDGSVLYDSSMGGIKGFEVLSAYDFVDSANIGISGHSMGTWASWSTAAACPAKAVVLQCGELFSKEAYDTDKISFNNVLLLQAKFDEFNYFRDYKNTVTDELMSTDLRKEFLGLSTSAPNSAQAAASTTGTAGTAGGGAAPVATGTTGAAAEWNKTYGSFSDGTARRIELINTNHRLTTHDHHALTAALDWFEQSLGVKYTIASSSHVYGIKEWLVFAAFLMAVFAMLPLLNLLLAIPYFSKSVQALPSEPGKIKTNKQWLKGAIITMAISALTYPFMTQLGHGLLPLPEGIFRMTIGNGFLSWYLLLIIIMIITTIIPWKKSRKLASAGANTAAAANSASKPDAKGTPTATEATPAATMQNAEQAAENTQQGSTTQNAASTPLNWYDIGLAPADKSDKIGWKLFGKNALLSLILLGFVYILVTIFTYAFQLDFRMIWPFLKPFTLERFGQFCVYFPVFFVFFLLNNSKIFAQMRTKYTLQPGTKGYWQTFWRNAVCMAGGIFFIILLEYIPFFAGLGPGADLLFGTTFGGPFMSLLIVFFPQILVFSLLGTYMYRKTGSVYTGAFVISALACWIVTGGSAIL